MRPLSQAMGITTRPMKSATENNGSRSTACVRVQPEIGKLSKFISRDCIPSVTEPSDSSLHCSKSSWKGSCTLTLVHGEVYESGHEGVESPLQKYVRYEQNVEGSCSHQGDDHFQGDSSALSAVQCNWRKGDVPSIRISHH